jgi:hypothetical protein
MGKLFYAQFNQAVNMTRSDLTLCWTAIQSSLALSEDSLLPLVNISVPLQHFELDLPKTPSNTNAALNVTLPDQPSYGVTHNEHIVQIRSDIYDNKHIEKTEEWAEKLLRFCEVRNASLQNRTLEKCSTPEAAKLHALLLCSLFMDFYSLKKDFRFLNTTLKLMDQRWIVDEEKLSSRLNKTKKASTIDALEFRAILTSHHAVEILKNA